MDDAGGSQKFIAENQSENIKSELFRTDINEPVADLTKTHSFYKYIIKL